MAQRKTTKIVSKKHLARLERERRQTRIIVIVSIVILAFILLSIAYGALNETVLLNYKSIEVVNGEKVTVREFQARSRATREQLVNQYMYYYQLAAMFGMDPSTDPSLSQMFSEIQYQLESPETLANQVLSYIEDDLFIRQYAEKTGILITAEEIQAELESDFGYFPLGTRTPTLTSTPVTMPTLSLEQLAFVTATFTPTTGPARTAALIGTTLPSQTPTPTATPVTADSFQQSYQENLEHYKTLGFTEEMFRRIFFENALYRQAVKAIVTADVSHEGEQVWARHILVADETSAQAIYDLLQNGVDFATLASQYSTDPGSQSKGGDLGWFGRGVMVTEFEQAAFSQEIGLIGTPVKTENGYHIIQVLARENRPLTAEQYQEAVDAAFNSWLVEQRTAATIEVNPDLLAYVPVKPNLQEAFQNLFATQTVAAATGIIQQQTDLAILALTPSSTPLPPTATP